MKYLYLYLLFFVTNAFASIDVLHIPNSKLSLGGNADMNFPFQKKQRCLDIESLDWTQVDDGALRLRLKSELVHSREELMRSLNVDVKLSAKAKFEVLGGSAEYEHKMTKSFEGHKDSLNYLVQAYYDFGEKEARGLTLKAKFQQMLDEKRFDDFVAACGTHFVASTRQNVMVNMLITIKSLNSTEIKKVQNRFALSAQYGPISGDATASIASDFKYAQQFGQVNLTIDSIGGDPRVFNGFGNTRDIDKALASLEKFLGGVRKETSAPTRYTLLSFETFGLPAQYEQIDSGEFSEKAYFLALEIEEKLARLESELTGFGHVNVEAITRLRRAHNDLLHDNRRLQQLVNTCVQEKICNVGELNIFSVDVEWLSDHLVSHQVVSQVVPEFAETHFYGEVQDLAFVKNITIERFENGRAVFFKSLADNFREFSFDEKKRRFLISLERLEANGDDNFINNIRNIDYVVNVIDLLDRKETYLLRINKI